MMRKDSVPIQKRCPRWGESAILNDGIKALILQ